MYIRQTHLIMGENTEEPSERMGAIHIPKNFIVVLLIVLVCALLPGCGGSDEGTAAASSKAVAGKTSEADAGSSGNAADKSGSGTLTADAKSSGGGADKKGSAKGGYKAPAFRDAVFSEDSAEGNGEVSVDLSHTAEGYISLKADSDARLKLQVIKGDKEYLYDIVQEKVQVFPLQCGDGTYTVKVMKNVEGSKYFELYSCQPDVKLESEQAPFLRPNQYADYSKTSKCVKKAAAMAGSAKNEEDFVRQVYEYICKNVTYDKKEAATVAKGYIPDPDEVMDTGKGICFDYASLGASMLRSQGVPAKIIFGYVEPDDLYHAWNMFYTKEGGWKTVEFKVDPKKWNRIDLTFSANGANSKFIGDGSNYMDVYEY